MIEIVSIEPSSAEPIPRLTRLGDLLGAWEADAEAAHQARITGAQRGPVTSLRRLDRELGGALAAGLHIVHAPPGAGKSAIVAQIAATSGCPALLVTCEMQPLEIFRRHTARATGTFLQRLKSGELRPSDSSISRARRSRPPPGWRSPTAPRRS